MVIQSLEDNSVLDMEDEAYRWYSKMFHTPLMEAYKLPAELVVFYKWKEDTTGIDRSALEEQKERFVKPSWNIVTQDSSQMSEVDLDMDDETWIAEEEAKVKAQEANKGMTDADLIRRAEDAIRGLTSKLTVFKDSDVKDKEDT